MNVYTDEGISGTNTKKREGFKSMIADALAGKEAVFKIKLHEIKLRELPEIDDEFAKDVSEFDTLDELKADLKAILVELQLEIEEIETGGDVLELAIKDDCKEIIQQKINALKADTEDQDGQTSN